MVLSRQFYKKWRLTELSHLPQATWLAKNKTRIRTQVYLTKPKISGKVSKLPLKRTIIMMALEDPRLLVFLFKSLPHVLIMASIYMHNFKIKPLMEFLVLAVWPLPACAVQSRATLLLPFWASGTQTFSGFLSYKERLLASMSSTHSVPCAGNSLFPNSLFRFQLTSHFLKKRFSWTPPKLSLPFLSNPQDSLNFSCIAFLSMCNWSVFFLPGLWTLRWETFSWSTLHVQCLARHQACDQSSYREEPHTLGKRKASDCFISSA